jgi:predicted transcriptional regulator
MSEVMTIRVDRKTKVRLEKLAKTAPNPTSLRRRSAPTLI